MVALSGAIKAGLSLGQSLRILADQCPRPICQEFRQIVGEFQLGKPLEVCLTETRDRLRSENFALFSAAMLASRESGGRLNETVDRIAHSVLEMQRVERKVIAETAQARASAVYMGARPLCGAADVLFHHRSRKHGAASSHDAARTNHAVHLAHLPEHSPAYLWARHFESRYMMNLGSVT